MSEPLKIKGIVVNSAPLGDNGKMLTVLTKERGVISVSAKGVKSLKNKNSQGVMPLCYSDFVLSERGDIFSLTSADIVESFYKLREDVEALSYGVYFAHLAAYSVGRENACEDEVRLLLNSLYFLCKAPERKHILKCAYELKICEYAGIFPYVESCSCGEEGQFFDPETGEAVCREHKGIKAMRLTGEARRVFDYVQNASLKETLTFDIPDSLADEVSGMVEAFLKHQFGRLPKSLDYIKKIVI